MKSLRIVLPMLLALSLAGCDNSAESSTGGSAPTNRNAKDPDPDDLPWVITTSVHDVSRIQASFEGLVARQGASSVTEAGACLSTQPLPTIADRLVLHDRSSSNFEIVLNDLQPGTTYHVRAFATNSHGTGYGDELEFTTDSALPPPTCTPEVNTTVINIAHQNYTTVHYDTNGVSWGDYAIVGHASDADMSAEFRKPPKTGLYETVLPQDLDFRDSTHVVIHGVVDNATVTALAGTVVSVVKLGDDRYSISFCNASFNYSYSGIINTTFKTNGNLTTTP